jgi:hypothetical protein
MQCAFEKESLVSTPLYVTYKKGMHARTLSFSLSLSSNVRTKLHKFSD